jgi:aminopeptidase YwaD
MIQRLTLLLLCFFALFHLTSQEIEYARSMIHILASDSMSGRGYQRDGDKLSADLIRREFIRNGLKPVGEEYLQPVIFPVNSIVGATSCLVDGKELTPGIEYHISARSKGREKVYDLMWLDLEQVQQKRWLRRLRSMDLSNYLLVIDPRIVAEKTLRDFYMSLYLGDPRQFRRSGPAGIVVIEDKPIWHISDSGFESKYLVIKIKSGSIHPQSKNLEINFSNQYNRRYQSNNVIGMVPGTAHPDSFIVFTAHYDHLGMMGEVMIPGANDNASGTAMILDLARHYGLNPARYSIAFMAFTGEEAGLIGSTFYAANPLFPLTHIKALINLDMVGTGSDGITLVNGGVFPDDYQILDSLNRTYQFLPEVKNRGESANSDHHPFYAKKVKAFFIYTMGKEHQEYHNIYDLAERLPLTGYEGLFRLLTKFADQYME